MNKNLTETEILKFAKDLCFSYQDAENIIRIFDEEQLQGNRIIGRNLCTIEDYEKEWEDNWYRFSSWQELVESEKGLGEDDGMAEEQCEEELGNTIFKLSTEMYIQYV